VPKGWDHDPPAKRKLTPYGILTVATGASMVLFGWRDTSDAWVDASRMWWTRVGPGLGSIKRLVIYLDNGPNNSGRRTQFLKPMVEFADWSGREIRLVY
jgi:Rhodopirellula transposase DDE domain